MSYVLVCDKMSMEYEIYGDPNGFPVLFFHGFMGSFHQAAPVSESARKQGICLIAFNRPGIGWSSDIPSGKQSALEWCRLLIKLLQQEFTFQKCSVIGVSGGAPYALGMAALVPKMIGAVGIVSGVGPLNELEISQHLPLLLRTGIITSNLFPFLSRLFFAWQRRKLLNHPATFVNHLLRKFAPECADDAEIKDAILNDMKAVFRQKSASRSLTQEIYALTHWGFSGEKKFGPPIQWWHGKSDNLISPEIARITASRLGAQLELLDGGHFIAYHIQDRILAQMHSHATHPV